MRGWETGLGQPSACPEPLDTSPHGVTFLAFGNGAPDIFSALVAFSDPRTAGLAFGALFGMSEQPQLRVRGWEGSRRWEQEDRAWPPLPQARACW